MEHVFEVVRSAALSNLNNAALIYKDKHLTFSSLLNEAAQVAAFLDKNQHVGLCVNNANNYYTSYLAILQSGGAVVPISPNESLEKIIETLVITEASVLITDRVDLLNSISLFKGSIFDISNMEMKQIFSPTRNHKHPHAALLLRTSGSTGNPKVVHHSHKSLLWVARAHNKSIDASQDQRALIILPLWTSFVHTTQFLAQLIMGATSVVLDSPYLPQDVYNYIVKYRIDTMGCVPTNLKLFNTIKPKTSQVKGLKLIVIAGAALNSADLLEAKQTFADTKLLKAYGLTEAGPRVTCQKFSEELRKGVGKPLEGIKVQIIDEKEKALLPNEVGEICIKGPGLMLGYFDNIQATNEVYLDDGWLRTGDLGTLDPDGHLHILGRKKNVINVGGNTVYPEELEDFFSTCINIKDVLITGGFDPFLGEKVQLKIVLIDEKLKEETLSTLRNSFIDKLSNFKRPKEIEIVSYIPKTENGKISRKQTIVKE